jgi:hypothetical protein
MGICHIDLLRMIMRPSRMEVRKKGKRVRGLSMVEHSMGELLRGAKPRKREKGIWGWGWVYNLEKGKGGRVEIKWRVMKKVTGDYRLLPRTVMDEMDIQDHQHLLNYFEPSHLDYHLVRDH